MEKPSLQQYIDWFQDLLTVAFQLYFRQECPVHSIRDVPDPQGEGWRELFGLPAGVTPSFDEQVVMMLALMPHLSPQVLDIFFVHNKNFDRPYTEFGGWKGLSHGGFLPTGETAAFVLAGDEAERRREIVGLFNREHWFYRLNVLRLEGQNSGEPFLSGQLRASDELIHRVVNRSDYKPDYSSDFPARRITTALEWDDLVLDYQVAAEVEEINTWLTSHTVLMETWQLRRFLKDGYRALLYGPPGTGKTLTATLLGKRNAMDVYRVDLSMIVSKYIGETEKNLARIFDQAENRNWILFFDEADALFGKRTSTTTSNDRHANQEVAYLLQRIEDFPGTVLLATNLRGNIDEAFFRRFQAAIYFPMPDREQRLRLWRNMLPTDWLDADSDALLQQVTAFELSGGSIANIVRRCALQLIQRNATRLSRELVLPIIQKELYKEGKI